MTRRSLRAVVGLFFLALIWLAVSGLSADQTLAFPSPNDVLDALSRRSEEFLSATMLTTYRVAGGMTAGMLAAYALFSLGYLLPSVRQTLNPIIELLRPIPPVALTPFFIIWLGIGSISQISMIAVGAFMVIYLGLCEAESGLPLPLNRTTELFGRSTFQRLRKVVLPALTPTMVGPFRIALATSFGITIAAEFLGAQGGLGFIIRNARTILQLDAILAAVIILGVVASSSDWLLRRIVIAITPWHERSQ